MQDEVRVTVVATGLNRAVTRQSVRDRADFGMETSPRKPQVQLIHTQGRRDGTTGMMLDEMDAYAPAPNQGIGASLRRGGSSEPAPAVADFGNDSSYLDIPAFLRRQAD